MSRGRPPKESGRKSRPIVIRLDEEDLERLEYLAYESDESMSDILRKAFKMYYNFKKS